MVPRHLAFLRVSRVPSVWQDWRGCAYLKTLFCYKIKTQLLNMIQT